MGVTVLGIQHNFYPRSPCGERPSKLAKTSRTEKISIHALLAESDQHCLQCNFRRTHFYPRSPCGERLHYDNYNLHCVEISIHALLAESDSSVKWQFKRYIIISIHALLAESDRRPGQTAKANKDFYPRSPCGERPPPAPQGKSSNKFLSTLSLRRATVTSVARTPTTVISIHALLAESDPDQPGG